MPRNAPLFLWMPIGSIAQPLVSGSAFVSLDSVKGITDGFFMSDMIQWQVTFMLLISFFFLMGEKTFFEVLKLTRRQ